MTITEDGNGVNSVPCSSFLMAMAPMVRISTLPMRLLALEYGADLVFTPELVDKKLLSTRRVMNEALGTVDYVEKNSGGLVFRTCPFKERSRLILQLGTASASTALQAAKYVAQDVSGIDINCGCPKRFSVHAGMGAALLKDPDRLMEIVKTLVREPGLPPVSAKIRLLPNLEESRSLIQRLLASGIHVLTIHARFPSDRSEKQPARHEILLKVLKQLENDSPHSPPKIIVNGDVWSVAQGISLCKTLGVQGFMMARAAQRNVSCFFNEERAFSLLQVSIKLIELSMLYQNPFANTKYILLQMWMYKDDEEVGDNKKKTTMTGLQKSKSYIDLCSLFEMDLGQISTEIWQSAANDCFYEDETSGD